jgi:hypothetical protein
MSTKKKSVITYITNEIGSYYRIRTLCYSSKRLFYSIFQGENKLPAVTRLLWLLSRRCEKEIRENGFRNAIPGWGIPRKHSLDFTLSRVWIFNKGRGS